jgi:hypothetical protein
MVDVVGKALRRGPHGDVVAGGVPGHLLEVHARKLRGQRRRRAVFRFFRRPGEAIEGGGVAVDAPEFHRDVAGTEVTFLHHDHRQVDRPRALQRHLVVVTVLAEQDDAVRPLVPQQRPEERRPAGAGLGEPDGGELLAVGLVTAVEGDTIDLASGGMQPVGTPIRRRGPQALAA